MARNVRNRYAKYKVINRVRMLNGKEVKPVRFTNNGGKGIMVAQYKDTRDLVEDENGKPVAWSRA